MQTLKTYKENCLCNLTLKGAGILYLCEKMFKVCAGSSPTRLIPWSWLVISKSSFPCSWTSLTLRVLQSMSEWCILDWMRVNYGSDWRAMRKFLLYRKEFTGISNVCCYCACLYISKGINIPGTDLWTHHTAGFTHFEVDLSKSVEWK